MTITTTKPSSRAPLGASKVPPRVHFIRAAFASAMAHANKSEAAKYLRAADPEIALGIIEQRADQLLGTTTGSHWADDIAQVAWRDFLSDLSPYSGAARLIAQAVPADVGSVQSAHYPVRAAGPALPGWVEEAKGIPVRSVAFSNVDIGPAKKMAHMLVWSRELGKRSDARRIFEMMLREDVAAGIDAAFFSTDAGSASTHVGLLYGVTATTSPTSGAKADLGALASAAATGGSGNVTFIVPPALLAQLRIAEPELASSIDIVASAALPAGRVVACDAAALMVSVDASPDIQAGNAGTVHMSDVPLEIVSGTGPTAADPVRDIWSTGSTSLRVIHDLAFAKRRSTAVAFIDGANWS